MPSVFLLYEKTVFESFSFFRCIHIKNILIIIKHDPSLPYLKNERKSNFSRWFPIDAIIIHKLKININIFFIIIYLFSYKNYCFLHIFRNEKLIQRMQGRKQKCYEAGERQIFHQRCEAVRSL